MKSTLQILLALELLLPLAAGLEGHKNNNCNDNTTSASDSAIVWSDDARTPLLPAVERVFSRRRRFVLMPKGGALKFTAAVSKRLLAMYPRGFNFGVEAAFYYPAVASRADLLPKRLRKPTTTTPKPAGPTPPLFVHIPGSLVRYKAKPAKKPAKVQRIGTGPVQWVDSRPPSKFADPQRWLQYAKYGEAAYQRHQYQYQYQGWTPAPAAKWTRWTTPRPSTQWWQPPSGGYAEWSQRGRRGGRAAFDSPDFDELPPPRLMEFADLEPFEETWRHFHGHRDRRQLFATLEGFSKALGFDMKACVLRAICECKRLLLPPGYSMLQDMIRVVFTLPTRDGLTDDYSRTQREESEPESCEHRFRPSCPVSLLGWLLSPAKGSSQT